MYFSALSPCRSTWPSSVLGTRRPSTKVALPTPVPRVNTCTTPELFRPAPNSISAMPAASASLTTNTSWPVRSVNRASTSVPIQDLSTFAAVFATPSWITAGKVTPTGMSSATSKEPMSSATVSATASGVEGCGVGIRTRSAASSPLPRWTGAPLMPLPPMSIPKAFLLIVSPWSCDAGRPRPVPGHRPRRPLSGAHDTRAAQARDGDVRGRPRAAAGPAVVAGSGPRGPGTDRSQTTVRSSGPASVMSMVCSNWAE